MAIRIDGTNTAANPGITGADTDTGLQIGTDELSLVTGGSARATVDSSGNVGIGTSSPQSALNISAGSGGDTSGLRITRTDAGGGDWRIWSSATVNGEGAGKLIFGNTANRVAIDSSGNVGIGTTSPDQKLHVYGNSGTTFISVGDQTRTAPYGYFGADASAGKMSLVSRSAHPLTFQIETTEVGRFDTSGRLLVGTSSSDGSVNLLQITGNTAGNSGGNISLSRGAIPTAVNQTLGLIAFGDGGGDVYAEIKAQCDGTAASGDAPGRLVFSTTADGASSPTERMRITNSGTISYNSATIAHGALFAATNGSNAGWVFGPNSSSAYVVYNSAGSGVYLTSGNTSWTGQSDERLKTNLTPIEDGLGKVGALRAVTGRFKTDENSVSRSFLIAQDVQAVFPEAVDATDENALGLRYTEVIPLLVAALKESKDRIETLEAKVATLEAAS